MPNVHILESCCIAPPPGSSERRSLPLTFIDIFWMHFHPIRRLLFYNIPCSREHLLANLVPHLKQSLSVALKHYFPLAGSFEYPLVTEKQPAIRYNPGDSVSFTVAESAADFDNLIGNHARDADQLYDFIPELPSISEEKDCKLLPVLAVQVTLFPGRGLCVGLANHHIVGDASSMVGFILSWANLCRHGGDENCLITEGNSPPIFDRSLVSEPPGASSFFWNIMRQIPLKAASPFPLPTNRVRATYVVGEFQVKKLKEKFLERKPGVVHVSSFLVTAAYVWTCLAKSLVLGRDEKVEDDAEEVFLFAIDVRARLDPPVPGNYFGNCLGYGVGKTRHRELIGEEGFIVAAEAIATEIQNRVKDKDLLGDFENWIQDVGKLRESRMLAVSGSTMVHVYNADFGWGKVTKMETLSIDGENTAMSLCKSSEGGLEIGLSLPNLVMDAFAAAFARGLGT